MHHADAFSPFCQSLRLLQPDGVVLSQMFYFHILKIRMSLRMSLEMVDGNGLCTSISLKIRSCKKYCHCRMSGELQDQFNPLLYENVKPTVSKKYDNFLFDRTDLKTLVRVSPR